MSGAAEMTPADEERAVARRRRERLAVRTAIGVAVVLVLVTVLGGIFRGAPDSGESRFVQSIRRANPTLSVAVATDDRLAEVARSTCRPDGMSSADEVWLDSVDVDVDDFVHRAEVLCPSR